MRRRRPRPDLRPKTLARLVAGAALACGAIAHSLLPVRAQESVTVDTALLLAVDVSQSVDAERYRLQMEGIARALEDDDVIDAITSGPQGAILLALVTWADGAEMALSWQLIAGEADARRVARRIRELPHRSGEFTCTARMMGLVGGRMLQSLPARPARLVLDVSGDGTDNCAETAASDRARDELVAKGVTINGLPIIVEGENDIVGRGAYRAPGYGLHELPTGPDTDAATLETWYRDHVIGGPAAFLHAAQGYEDFGRAFRHKFVTEISARN